MEREIDTLQRVTAEHRRYCTDAVGIIGTNLSQRFELVDFGDRLPVIQLGIRERLTALRRERLSISI